VSDGPAMVAGVDSSTQSCKIVVCELESGEIVRMARATHPDGTEVSAEAWFGAFQESTADPGLLEGVQALAVGGQQHGMVTLDESGELVRDALLWNDNRSAPDAVDLIAERGGPQAWADAVGTVPVASMTVSKIRWLARCEPGNAARTTGVVLPHDWLTWQIGGRSFEPVTDRGDASGTCYFDASANAYRRDLIELGIGHDLAVPRVAAPHEIVGTTPNGVALAPGTGDNMAAGLGLGLRRGMGAVSLGRSGTVFTLSDEQTHDGSGVVAGFADATGAFLPLVCTLNGARNLVATATMLGLTLDEFSSAAMSAPAGSDGVTFLPYLEGERTPLPNARGQLVGLTLSNRRRPTSPGPPSRGCCGAWPTDCRRCGRRPARPAGSRSPAVPPSRLRSERSPRRSSGYRSLPPSRSRASRSAPPSRPRGALTGSMPEWPVPYVSEQEPTSEDVAAAQEINARYESVLQTNFLRAR
jgi:xylulokinase